MEPEKTIKIKATGNTFLKKLPVAASQLPDAQKIAVPAGKEYEATSIKAEGPEYVRLELAHGQGSWLAFTAHWSGLEAKSDSKVLSTPYFSQRDNIASGDDLPYRTCFSSSCAMLAVTVKPGCVSGDDEYIRKRKPFGDSTDSSAQVACLKSLGIKARFVTNANVETVKKQIDRGIPVPCGILHHGGPSAPSGGGHWICVIGYDSKGFIVNDPWGEIDNATGTYPSTNGKRVRYSYSLFDARWTVKSGSDGWAILVD